MPSDDSDRGACGPQFGFSPTDALIAPHCIQAGALGCEIVVGRHLVHRDCYTDARYQACHDAIPAGRDHASLWPLVGHMFNNWLHFSQWWNEWHPLELASVDLVLEIEQLRKLRLSATRAIEAAVAFERGDVRRGRVLLRLSARASRR